MAASCRVQPMLKDLDFHDVVLVSGIVGPYILLAEADPIERLRRKAVAHLRQLFRIWKAAAQALDRSGVAADIERRADMPERRGAANAHLLPDPEARRHRRKIRFEHGLHFSFARRAISSILRPRSSVVIAPRWMSVCASAVTHLS